MSGVILGLTDKISGNPCDKSGRNVLVSETNFESILPMQGRHSGRN
jgi:hypothetical protein